LQIIKARKINLSYYFAAKTYFAAVCSTSIVTDLFDWQCFRSLNW